MGAFDAFVGDDDDQPAGGLIDLVAVLQGKCSNQRVVEVKAAYMRLKERKITLVDFLKLARDAVGEDALVKTLAASRLAAERNAARAPARAPAQKQKPPSASAEEKKGKAARDGDASAAADPNGDGAKDAAAARKDGAPPPALDVAVEAEDVLAIAGVDTEDEQRLMYGADAAAAAAGTGPSHAVSGDKDRWRKLVELRIFARVCGEDGLAAKCGVRHVNDKAYEFLEEALHARLRGFVERVVRCAGKRHDANRGAFSSAHVTSAPRRDVRGVNVAAEREKVEREEKERARLLKFGASATQTKRKRADLEENVALKEKIEKAQAEEEERLRAATANQAARDALGDTRASKWLEMAKEGKTNKKKTPANVDAKAPPGAAGGDPSAADAAKGGSDPAALGSKLAAAVGAGAGGLRGANVVADSVALKDCVEALRGDPRGKILRAKAARMRE